MADTLTTDISVTVGLLKSVRGRVIISGMGKSGHIAKKIAATMASTGTPAQFVHPAEASHGDLGMITEDDAIMLISNSGESRELSDIIEFSRRHRIPMIAITKNPDSTLASHADHVLTLPDAPEACAIGMAPTTSTTCSLALGDGIAVALMQVHGFDRDKFSVFHPGGSLGANLRAVRSVMHTGESLPVVAPNDNMSSVLLTMTSKGFGVAALVDGGKLVGAITDGDLRRNMKTLLDKRAEMVANPTPITVPEHLLIGEALSIMNERKVSSLFVVGVGQKLVGLIHIHDLIRAGVI
ncbi:KpsF/GutQ family sugar-phosphate isomerase [Celeribacter sp.]|uniref:KpsF/GutQ family sugar-phosphate isomerase n=1 Tax=Celeribacter sp. TaxID=1890673 RepID=UPI003A915A7E